MTAERILEPVQFQSQGSIITGGDVPDDSLAREVALEIASEYPESVPFVMPISTPDPGEEAIIIDGEKV